MTQDIRQNDIELAFWVNTKYEEWEKGELGSWILANMETKTIARCFAAWLLVKYRNEGK